MANITNPSSLQPPSGNQTVTTNTQGPSSNENLPEYVLPPPIDAQYTGGEGGGGGDGTGGSTTQATGGGSTQTYNQNSGPNDQYSAYFGGGPAASGTGANIGTTGTTSGAGGGSGSAAAQVSGAINSDVINRYHSGGLPGVSAMLAEMGGGDDFTGMSIEAIVLKVLLESYDGVVKDLRSMADRTSFYNALKNNIRTRAQQARAALADAGSTDSLATPFSVQNVPATTTFTNSTGVAMLNSTQMSQWTANTPLLAGAGGSAASETSAYQKGGVITTKNALAAYADSCDNDLQNVGDDQQKANTELQDLTQKQQTLITEISQLYKTYNDTNLSIVRNI